DGLAGRGPRVVLRHRALRPRRRGPETAGEVDGDPPEPLGLLPAAGAGDAAAFRQAAGELPSRRRARPSRRPNLPRVRALSSALPRARERRGHGGALRSPAFPSVVLGSLAESPRGGFARAPFRLPRPVRRVRPGSGPALRRPPPVR